MEYTPPETAEEAVSAHSEENGANEFDKESAPAYECPYPPIILGEPPPPRNLKYLPDPNRPSGRTEHAFSHRLRAAAHMAALGMKTGQIAQSLGITPSRMSVINGKPEFKQLVQEIQRTVFVNDPQAAFRQMAPQAAKTLYQVLADTAEKGSTRVSAASEVLDRAYGKATQTLQHEGSMVKDLFRQLDEERKIRDNKPARVLEGEFHEVIVDDVDRIFGEMYGEKGADRSKEHGADQVIIPHERESATEESS